jgi:hypothetical protein
MTATDARVEVLAAVIRALAQALPAEQSEVAASLFLRHARPTASEVLSDAADQAASAEVVGVMMALAR